MDFNSKYWYGMPNVDCQLQPTNYFPHFKFFHIRCVMCWPDIIYFVMHIIRFIFWINSVPQRKLAWQQAMRSFNFILFFLHLPYSNYILLQFLLNAHFVHGIICCFLFHSVNKIKLKIDDLSLWRTSEGSVFSRTTDFSHLSKYYREMDLSAL